MTEEASSAKQESRLVEVAALFLKLGFTAFGGPAAHIAMMHREVVQRRRWLDEQAFLDLLGATNLIPGPNSTEMAIHLGFRRAGWVGLVLGGVCFIGPAMLIVLVLAWAYARFGATPQAMWLLYGVKPVVIAVIAQALWGLSRRAITGAVTGVVAAGVFALYLAGAHELLLLFLGGIAVMLVTNRHRLARMAVTGILFPLGVSGVVVLTLAPVPFSLEHLFLTFLKIGAVLYGSGYVLLAFLRGDFVVRYGWLTDTQLLDAVAIGQVTPGPVFTTATFIGYILGGGPGALVATLGIFLPSFVFVALSGPLIPRLRQSPWASGLLDGVNAASLGLMAAVTWQLGRTSLVDPWTVFIGLASLVALARYNVNTTWLIVWGALAGWMSTLWP